MILSPKPLALGVQFREYCKVNMGYGKRETPFLLIGIQIFIDTAENNIKQWFPAFLILQPFNKVSHVMMIPNY